MSLTIDGNIASLEAKRAASRALRESEKGSLERLTAGPLPEESEGAETMLLDGLLQRYSSADLRGMNQAIRNANAHISLIQVAEEALLETESALRRMQDVASQSMDGELADGERESLNREVIHLVHEINRIAEQPEQHRLQSKRDGVSVQQLPVPVEGLEAIPLPQPKHDALTLGLQEEAGWEDPQQVLDAMDRIHGAMEHVAEMRKELDLAHSRFELVIERLTEMSQRALAERSAIQSAEEADRMAQLAREAIAGHADQAVAAQANQHPMLVSLLLV
uniref:Flagellin n=1 Tax=Magnetococcus massalia (strain MO-1) TaxID=451514 RepID=I3V6X3_MAGMO|nr:flagellin protein FliC11 [Candidatus Magnetococcus massalia]CRH07707.1 flagellin [Candidatus Magnetococcus massalia]